MLTFYIGMERLNFGQPSARCCSSSASFSTPSSLCLVAIRWVIAMDSGKLSREHSPTPSSDMWTRFWNNPGAFKPLYYQNNTGYFLGFLQCLIQAGFTIAGPDYVSMAAGEAENPRRVMPIAYNAVFYRLTCFFVLGSLCVGIVVPYDDPTLIAAFENGEPGAAASPYVVSMIRLKIQVLPHIVNALVLTSAFSAGLSYLYCSSRALLGLALEGKAPRIFTRTTRNGVPVYAVCFVLLIALLAFLQLGQTAATVLSWFVSIITASQLINFSAMVSPSTLPHSTTLL